MQQDASAPSIGIACGLCQRKRLECSITAWLAAMTARKAHSWLRRTVIALYWVGGRNCAVFSTTTTTTTMVVGVHATCERVAIFSIPERNLLVKLD